MSTLSVRFRPFAEMELEGAQQWYDEKRPGWGSVFRGAVDKTFKSIQEAPEKYPVVHKDVRQALVGRFPYAIYYQIGGEEVAVLSVFHASRDPQRWQERA